VPHRPKKFIHVDDVLLPCGLNILWWMKYFVHMNEKYFHMASEKRVGSEWEFWIFQSVELTKETKG
jgi:hypothetical protein